MLTTLRIKNLALVEDLTVEFQPGYNVITGETGAGKSILIGALTLVLGERADRTLIRSGSDAASVEAVFDISRLRTPIQQLLEDNGLEPCEAGQFVLKRSFTNAGTNRQFVNGSPTTLAVLGELGELLVDIHGPHEHQSLLHPASQLAVLDAFGGLDAEREAFVELARRNVALEHEKAGLIVDEKTYAQQLDLLRFQATEISAAKLQPHEELQVEQDFRRASNAARLLELSQAASRALNEEESSLLTQAGVVGRSLQELQRVDAAAAPLLTLLEQAVTLLRELQTELTRYSDKVDVDPAQLAKLEERLNLIHALKRKYGASLAEVIAWGEEAQRKLHTLEQRESELAKLNAELQQNHARLLVAGQALSAKRRKVIPQLCKAAGKQLEDLGFKQSRLEICLTALGEAQAEAASNALPIGDQTAGSVRLNETNAGANPRFSSTGLDRIEFLFAPNPGEPPRPLRAIASSGELARVMLALKTVLAAEDRIPVLVFDEVDANVGGETAHAVGQKMWQIARQRQVLCITHLAQVAAPASAHFVATKSVRAGRTLSEISRLETKSRVTELARMLGGQSDAARRHAEALLEHAR